MVTVEDIRAKITFSGWKLSERPMRNGVEVRGWKLIAEKGERSFTVEGETLLSAIQKMGKLLGVWKP